jgi:hypothetical protein
MSALNVRTSIGLLIYDVYLRRRNRTIGRDDSALAIDDEDRLVRQLEHRVHHRQTLDDGWRCAQLAVRRALQILLHCLASRATRSRSTLERVRS